MAEKEYVKGIMDIIDEYEKVEQGTRIVLNLAIKFSLTCKSMLIEHINGIYTEIKRCEIRSFNRLLALLEDVDG
jgi:hypothetical protein